MGFENRVKVIFTGKSSQKQTSSSTTMDSQKIQRLEESIR